MTDEAWGSRFEKNCGSTKVDSSFFFTASKGAVLQTMACGFLAHKCEFHTKRSGADVFLFLKLTRNPPSGCGRIHNPQIVQGAGSLFLAGYVQCPANPPLGPPVYSFALYKLEQQLPI